MARKKKPQKRSHGEGSIYERSDGRYEAKVTVYDPVTGKAKRISIYDKDPDVLYQKYIDLQNKKLTNKLTDFSKLTTWQWIYEWLYTYKKPKIKPTTFDNYEVTARTHIKETIGDIPLKGLTSEHIQRLYDLKIKEGKSTSTLYNIQKIINGALEKAVETRKIDMNPNKATELPQLEHAETEPFTAEEIKKFLTVIKTDRHYMAIKMDIKLGLRLGELISLRWSDIDFKNSLININRTVARVRKDQLDSKEILDVVKGEKENPKTYLVYMKPKTKKSESAVLMSDKLKKELEIHKKMQDKEKNLFKKFYKDNDLVFCNQNGSQLDPKNFREHYQYLLKQAELPVNKFHALRHTLGTLLLEAGEDIKVVSEILRHESLETTADIYVKVTEKLKKKAMSRIDEIV